MNKKTVLRCIYVISLVVLLMPVGCSPKPAFDKSLLFQSGDLPIGYLPGEVTSAPQWITNDLPEAEEVIYEPIEKNQEFSGAVAIFLYENKSEAENTYEIILANMGDNRIGSGDGGYSDKISEIGDKSAIAVVWDPQGHSFGIYGADFSFMRCNSVVSIRYFDELPQNEVLDNIILYAKKLDDRINPVVCEK